MSEPITITVFRWAGAWGPFKVNIPCGECSLTRDIIHDCMETDLAGIDVTLDLRDWLSEWWKPLPKGGLACADRAGERQDHLAGCGVESGACSRKRSSKQPHNRRPWPATTSSAKPPAPHCIRAKDYLQQAGVANRYYDVVKDTRALYEMLARVKPIIGAKTPVTVPQIWIEGDYVGGADALKEILRLDEVVPNPERGQCSLSPAR